jgi:hypothetical protein
MRLPVLLIAVVAFLNVTPAFGDVAEAESYLAKYEVPPPTVSQVVICHGFGCAFRTPVGLNAKDIAQLRDILGKGQRSARDEINAIANAVSWFERRVGRITGTSRRTPRAGPDQAGIASEADCIDESVNTTSLLLLLSGLKLLRHHEVAAPEARGFLLDMRYPHATAVVTNSRTGSRWAIDPWTKRNGEGPDTLPIERWMQGS